MFEEKRIDIGEAVEARKRQIADEEAWSMLSAAETIVAGRGKKWMIFDPRKDKKEDILKDCLGRTGSLRAPTLKIGKVLLVGFNEGMYAEYLEK